MRYCICWVVELRERTSIKLGLVILKPVASPSANRLRHSTDMATGAATGRLRSVLN
jgi:hypothetical protein